jgi:peptidoglycan/xylan/chitin deacetylase (PgdA/CDA1 family)
VTVGLIYHDVVAAAEHETCGFPGPAAARYKLEPERFERHLDAIAGSGASVGLSAERPRVMLTFDDGGASAPAAAAALERRGWRGHFFITTGRIGTPGFVSAAQVRDLADRGHDVGSHSDSHPTYMGSLGRSELAGEWRRSRHRLEEVLGTPPASAAVPGGFLSRAVIEEAAAAGYRLLMTSEPTSRRRCHGEMEVQGRFTIWAATPPARVGAYARGELRARAEMWIAWQGKSISKRLSPAVYESLRQGWAQTAGRGHKHR